VGGFVRRLGAGQRHRLCLDFGRDRHLAGLTGFIAQQTVNPTLGKALQPSSHGRPAKADALRHQTRRVPIRRSEHNARTLDMLARTVTVGNDRCQPLSLRVTQLYAYWLCHTPSPKSQPHYRIGQLLMVIF